MGTRSRPAHAAFLAAVLFLLAFALQTARAQEVVPRATPRADPQAAPEAAQEAAKQAERNAALELYRALLVQTCAKLRGYPEEAQRQGLTGAATVFLIIGADGNVSEEHLANSSGHAALDAFALDVLRRAVPLTQIPSALHNSVFEVAVVMVFALPQNWNQAGNPLQSSAHQRVTYLQNE